MSIENKSAPQGALFKCLVAEVATKAHVVAKFFHVFIVQQF